MQGVEAGQEIASRPRRDRSGRPRARLLTSTRVGLLLTLTAVLPWVGPWIETPGDLPMRRSAGRPKGLIIHTAIDPAARWAASIDEQHRVVVRPIFEGKPAPRRLEVEGRARSLAFSPDGRRLAVGRLADDILIFDLDRGSPGHPTAIPIQRACDLRFTPDGKALAVACSPTDEVIVWDLEAHRPRMVLREAGQPVWRLAMSPDGRSLAGARHGREGPVIVWDLTGDQPRHRLFPVSGAVYALAFSPDSRRLAASMGDPISIRNWDLATGTTVMEANCGPLPSRGLAFSPDSQTLAAAGSDGLAYLLDAGTGRQRWRLDAGAESLTGVTFTPDGRTLLATASDDDIRTWDLPAD